MFSLYLCCLGKKSAIKIWNLSGSTPILLVCTMNKYIDQMMKNSAHDLRYLVCHSPVLRHKQSLIHLSLTSRKRYIGKQCSPRSDATFRGVWSGSALFALSTGIYIKHGDKKTDVSYNDNGFVQRTEVEECTRHKWVKGMGTLSEKTTL